MENTSLHLCRVTVPVIGRDSSYASSYQMSTVQESKYSIAEPDRAPPETTYNNMSPSGPSSSDSFHFWLCCLLLAVACDWPQPPF